MNKAHLNGDTWMCRITAMKGLETKEARAEGSGKLSVFSKLAP